MGQTNLDKEFREKLEAREIAPSAQAWDRLDAMLSVTESQREKPARRIGWIYYAAASIVAVLLAVLLMTRGDDPSATIHRVVEAPSLPETRNVKEQDFKLVPESKVSPAPRLAPKNRQAVAQAEHRSTASEPQTVEHAVEVHLANNHEKALHTINPGPGVDELLAAAGTGPTPGETRVKVDAGTLLSQVDGELELTFREKVIRTVGKNYKNVKVALANRNQE